MKYRIILIALLITFPFTNQALISATTAKTVKGENPKLSDAIEQSLDNLSLFGVRYQDPVTNKSTNYYGNSVDSIPIKPAYPFKRLFSVAPIKQPNSSEYNDPDGDLLNTLSAQTSLTMKWLYSDNEIEFTPSANDSFCSLTSRGKTGPYKVLISGPLDLSSVYGDPSINKYPNVLVTTQPTKKYTILEDAGICYARPAALTPDTSKYAGSQWVKNKGFLTQSISDGQLNFPKTAFHMAKFDLLLADGISANNYNWQVVKGSQLVTINPSASIVSVSFNTSSTANTSIARGLVVPNGYEVIIEGTHRIKGYTIRYSFLVEKWFSGHLGTAAPTSSAKARDSATVIERQCRTLSPAGGYRVIYGMEASNAVLNSSAGNEALFTREIAPQIFSEWGLIDQKTYPGSFGYSANAARRFWVWNTDVNEYCDIHLYNPPKYHCRAEFEHKNGICVAI